MGKRQSRRRFLRQATGIVSLTVAAAARRRGSLANQFFASSRQGTLPIDEDDSLCFLPHISKGRVHRGPSKLGVHTVFADGAPDLVRQVSQAGAHVALVKALDDFGYLREVNEISPETIRVARRNDPWGSGITAEGDPNVAAQERMDWHMGVWELNRDRVDYWEVLNEADPPGVQGHSWLAEFYIACMRIAQENGYRLAIFSYSVGVPEWEEWEAIVQTGVFELAKSGGHILALHEYNWPHIYDWWGEPLPGHPSGLDRGVYTGRYRHLYEDFLIPQAQVIPLAITEAGYDPSVFSEPWDETWQERYVSEMAWYDNKLREDDYVIGCALFTLGGVGIWKDWDYSALLGDIGDYIISLKDHP